MSVLMFTIPPPLSANRMYTSGGGGRRILTDAARVYKERVGWAAKAAAIEAGWSTPPPYTFTLRVWFGSKRRADIDNAVKATVDAVAAALGFDDRYIERLVVERAGIDRANARGEVTITEYSHD